MSKKIKDFYNATDLENGDVLVCTVTLHVGEISGEKVYRMYRCEYPPRNLSVGIPQGSQIDDRSGEIAKQLFPITTYLGVTQDPYM